MFWLSTLGHCQSLRYFIVSVICPGLISPCYYGGMFNIHLGNFSLIPDFGYLAVDFVGSLSCSSMSSIKLNFNVVLIQWILCVSKISVKNHSENFSINSK